MAKWQVGYGWRSALQGSKVAGFCLAGWTLVACGETTRESGDSLTPTAGQPAAIGGATSAGAGAGATSVAGAGSGAGGSAGAPIDPGPPADIAGRWAMFSFEDPVGVRLVEGHDGSLTGRGCAAGAPGDDENEVSLCGDIAGKVTGFSASFGFDFDSEPGGFAYSARVTVSRDARRMTGTFSNGTGDSTFLMAWLRVRDGEVWLDRPPYDDKDPLMGRYDLLFVSSATGGTEYVAGKPYNLAYWRHAFSGSLGSFWGSEMSEPSQGSPVKIGPVAATSPELPVTVQAEFDALGFTRVTAQTASGNSYTFTATHAP